MKHGLILFYAKDRRKLTEEDLAKYKTMPLILFVSREPNETCPGELSDLGSYDYHKKQDEKSVSLNWTRPLTVLSYILDKESYYKKRKDIKTYIEEKGLCPIIFTYKHPNSIDNNNQAKIRLRNDMDHSEHINKILDLLNGYNVEMVIDHSAEENQPISIQFKNNPYHVRLDTYLGGRGNNKKLFKEIDGMSAGEEKEINRIWEEFCSKARHQSHF